MNKVFLKGSTWKHHGTKIVVYIQEARSDGTFVLACGDGGPHNRYLFRDTWTASELLEQFELLDPNEAEIKLSSWEKLLLDDL